MWVETAVKEHNEFQGQKIINLICIPSVLISVNYLPSSVGVCVAQSTYGIDYDGEERRLDFDSWQFVVL